jgi:hypothetical protein
MRVEDKYMDLLQNMELAIVLTYRKNPDMSDYDVMRVLEGLIDRYVGEKIGRPPRHGAFSELEGILAENVREMCEWRLGRAPLHMAPKEDGEADPVPISVDEIILCLKKLLKSAQRWNREGGRRGYLDFIVDYVE